MYNNNIGNGITIKKLFKTNHYQIKCSSTEFNKELLKKTQGQIFSSSITTKFTNYPLDHNKQLIEKLLNEKNEERKEIFINLIMKIGILFLIIKVVFNLQKIIFLNEL